MGPPALSGSRTGPARLLGFLALAALGAAVATVSHAGLVAVGAAGLLLAATAGPATVANLLIGATHATFFRFDLLGASLRAEHLVLGGVLASSVMHQRGAALLRAGRDRTSLWLAAFVAWSAVTSLVSAADPARSLLIVGWLALDWLLLVVVVATFDDARALARQGVVWAGAAATVAIGLWVAAGHGFPLGVSTETLTGARAAAGLAHEPNILGATLALWAFVALTCPGLVKARARVAIVAVLGAGLVLTLTRAAFLGLGAGLVVWGVASGRLARRTVLRVAVAAGAGLTVLALLAPGTARPVLAKGSEMLNLGSGTGQLRVEQWKLAVDDLDGLGWVVGLGTNSFGQRHLEPTLPHHPTPAYLGNLPLQVLYDTGLVGTALLAGVLVSVLGPGRRRDGRAAGLLTTYVLCAVATSPFWFGTTWLLVALGVIDRRHPERVGAAASAAATTTAATGEHAPAW